MWKSGSGGSRRDAALERADRAAAQQILNGAKSWVHKQLQETKEKAAEYRRLYGQSQTSSRAASQAASHAASQHRCAMLRCWVQLSLQRFPASKRYFSILGLCLLDHLTQQVRGHWGASPEPMQVPGV